MPINRDTTRKRNLAADERRVKGTGAATGGLGQAFLTQQTTRLTKYLEKVLAKHPTARKREIEVVNPRGLRRPAGHPEGHDSQCHVARRHQLPPHCRAGRAPSRLDRDGR